MQGSPVIASFRLSSRPRRSRSIHRPKRSGRDPFRAWARRRPRAALLRPTTRCIGKTHKASRAIGGMRSIAPTIAIDRLRKAPGGHARKHDPPAAAEAAPDRAVQLAIGGQAGARVVALEAAAPPDIAAHPAARHEAHAPELHVRLRPHHAEPVGRVADDAASRSAARGPIRPWWPRGRRRARCTSSEMTRSTTSAARGRSGRNPAPG